MPPSAIEANGELVESMNSAPEAEKEGPTMTMEERKAKMEQLRAKMVRPQWHPLLHLHPLPAR